MKKTKYQKASYMEKYLLKHLKGMKIASTVIEDPDITIEFHYYSSRYKVKFERFKPNWDNEKFVYTVCNNDFNEKTRLGTLKEVFSAIKLHHEVRTKWK